MLRCGLVVFVVCLALAALGCQAAVEADAHYRTRGRVESREGQGADLRALIHHERIADFKDRDGKPSPMDSMSMNFALGPGVDAAVFVPGAKLTLEFDVRWSNRAPLLITRVQKLPDSTALELTDTH